MTTNRPLGRSICGGSWRNDHLHPHLYQSRPFVATGVAITDIIPLSVTNASFVGNGVAITRTTGTRFVWQVQYLDPDVQGAIIVTSALAGSTSDPNEPTTLDAQGGGRVAYLNSGDVILENLYVTGGDTTYSGGGIYIHPWSTRVRCPESF